MRLVGLAVDSQGESSSLRHRVVVVGRTVLFGEDLCVATAEGTVYLEQTNPFSAVYSPLDLDSVI